MPTLTKKIMAIKYLSSINLTGLELQNARLHPLATEPAVGSAGAVYYNTATNLLKVSTGSAWVNVSGDITDVTAGTGIAVSGATAKTVSLSHLGIESLSDAGQDAIMFWDDSASATKWLVPTIATGIRITGTSLSLAGIPNSSLSNSSVTVVAGAGMTGGGAVALGGSKTLNVIAGTGITVNADSVELKGSGGLTTNVHTKWSGTQLVDSLVSDDGTTVTVAGNLTVTGTTTTVDSNTVNIGDNIIVLNSDETGTPSQDGGIEIERGTSTNVALKFDETSDRWEFTNNGSTYYNIPISSEYNNYTHPTDGFNATTPSLGDWEVITEIVVTEEGHIEQSNGITTGAINTVSASSTVEGLVELATTTEVKTGTDTARAVTPAGLAALSYAANIGNGVLTSVPVTHGLGTRDVSIQVYNASTFDTVYVETVRTSTSVVTLNFAVAPTTNQYRVVIARVAG